MPAAVLAPEDHDRLRAALRARDVDPRRSLYGPGTTTWRVNREAATLLGGGTALLLQVAHPLVAAGVGAHSRFRTEPLRRLWRTLDLMLTIAFADAATAIRAVRSIELVHARVHGVLDVEVGQFPAGTPYRAGDPRLLRWVHATLVHTAPRVYERFVGPLEPEAHAAYYEESKVSARLFGIPEDLLEPTLVDFEAYVRGMVEGDTLAIGATGREVAASILSPPLPPGIRHGVRLSAFVTAGLLPPALRERFGVHWDARRERVLGGFAAIARRTMPLVPGFVRWLPHARRALRSHPGPHAPDPGSPSV